MERKAERKKQQVDQVRLQRSVVQLMINSKAYVMKGLNY